MNTRHIICLKNGIVRNPLVRLDEPACFDLESDEHIAIIGPNGSGKSLLVDMITGRHHLCEGTLFYDFYPSASHTAYKNIKYITFRDTYGTADANYYYQQRWNAQEQGEVPEAIELIGKENIENETARNLLEEFGITPMLHKKIVTLSSGELRKLQIVKSLLAFPRVLIIDNPFIGLDAEARQLLERTFNKLSHWNLLQIILILTSAKDIPGFITHIVPINHKKTGRKVAKKEYLPPITNDKTKSYNPKLPTQIAQCPHPFHLQPLAPGNNTIVELHHIKITYDRRIILNLPEWIVRQGEKWALCGENGSGKSTLLSLICADNPQSYACDISLFGRKRGTGESIWDIKRRIGYVSPEMHRAYQKNLPTIDIVASGLHDTIGLYKQLQPEQKDICRWWMEIFGIAHLADKMFLQMSSGEQRMALLARAFVKDPELLVLDEPFHGLDPTNSMRARHIIDAFCQREGKTLIMVTHYDTELPQAIGHRLQLSKNT